MKGLLAAMALASTALGSAAAAQAPNDPHLWLEEWGGPKVDAWIAAENAATLGRLKSDPRFAGFEEQALSLLTAQDRIPAPMLLAGQVYNFWRDKSHPQGILRVTSEASFAADNPQWQTVLDFGALSAKEGHKWVFKGLTCLKPAETRCLVQLSDGGEDAVRIREFDLTKRAFVSGGFDLPRSKQDVAWVDADTLLVARDWGEGTLTASGYAYVTKRLGRGQALADAVEVYRGTPQDVASSPFTLEGGKNPVAGVVRAVDFFHSEYRLFDGARLVPVPVPARSSLVGIVDGQLVVSLDEPWTAGGATVPAGSLAAVPLAAVLAGEPVTPQTVLQVGERQSIDGTAISDGKLLVVMNDEVRGRALALAPGVNGWTTERLPLPDNQALNILAASDHRSAAYLLAEGFTDPQTLWRWDGKDGVVRTKATPARFDASGLEVRQYFATSTDGTQVPYFLVHRKDAPLDGSTPTLLNAYGGFQVSETPGYNPVLGKLWLERGNAFVLANIRGGGEFGPKWHEAGLKTKRQIVYDDFAAVARDLIARRLTSAEKLGIYGGSNGGLLMGVEFVQHPDLWRAVSIEVPLLDMLRMEKIAAGASWVGEYGSASVPEERAFWEKTSPYQNVRKGVAYPEPLIWTTTKDDRVGPQHARKFAARLKEYGIPYLYFEDTLGGHSGDADIAQRAMIQALRMTYFAEKLEGPAEK